MRKLTHSCYLLPCLSSTSYFCYLTIFILPSFLKMMFYSIIVLHQFCIKMHLLFLEFLILNHFLVGRILPNGIMDVMRPEFFYVCECLSLASIPLNFTEYDTWISHFLSSEHGRLYSSLLTLKVAGGTQKPALLFSL